MGGYYDKMSELIKVYFKASVSNIMGNKIVCVIPFESGKMEYASRLCMIEKARNLVSSLKNTVGIDFKAGIGAVRPWESVFDSYQEALNALRHGKRKVTHIDDLIVKDTVEKQRQVMEQVVLKAVLGGMEHDARQEAAVFAGWILKNESCTFEEARRQVAEQGGEGSNRSKTAGELFAAADKEELRRRFVAAMEELAREAVIQNQKPDGVITRAQEYIRQNFRRDLALEEVAQKAGISPYYFSKLFKEEVGMNFTEYLTGLRIDMAKELLLNRELSIKQVCVDSGYANPNYFSRIFKKWTGITPTEFRDGIQDAGC